MITVELPVFSVIQEDFLRYKFQSWDGVIKVSLAHPLGEGIFSSFHGSYTKQTFANDTKTIKLQLPKHANFNLERWPYHTISIQAALRIKMEVMSAYHAEVNRVVSISRRRTNLKAAITNFVDMLELQAGDDYNLHINYEQIRKMITRDDARLRKMLSEFNKRSVYQASV